MQCPPAGAGVGRAAAPGAERAAYVEGPDRNLVLLVAPGASRPWQPILYPFARKC
jgi:hypothetical protein